MRQITEVKVKESLNELKGLQKKHVTKFKALQMLMILKKQPQVRKVDLALQLGVSDKSIQVWRHKYLKAGIGALLEDKRGGKKPAAIQKATYDKLSDRLNDPKGGFRSFVEIQQWLSDEFGIVMEYHAVNKYVKRKFGARLKVSRKSHVLKTPADEAVFKKPV